MFENFNNGMKCGLLIMIFATMLILLLVLMGKPVFDLIMWLFFLGMIITLVSSITLKRRKFLEKEKNKIQ